MSNPTVTFNTTMGSIVAEIFLEQMPLTASNFLDLASLGFYNGLHFHRVIPQFMAQFGCPFAKDPNSQRAGTGGPKPGSQFRNMLTGEVVVRGDDGQGGGTIRDEHTARISNERGTLSMANAGPDTGGSQFFMNVAHNDFLDWFDPRTDSQHPVFGVIVQGMEVVDAITQVPTREERPINPIMVVSVDVQQGLPQEVPAQQTGAVVLQQIGDWQICEDGQGLFYHHVPTQQSFDQPPEELQPYLPQQARQAQPQGLQHKQQLLQQEQQYQQQQLQLQQQQLQQQEQLQQQRLAQQQQQQLQQQQQQQRLKQEQLKQEQLKQEQLRQDQLQQEQLRQDQLRQEQHWRVLQQQQQQQQQQHQHQQQQQQQQMQQQQMQQQQQQQQQQQHLRQQMQMQMQRQPQQQQQSYQPSPHSYTPAAVASQPGVYMPQTGHRSYQAPLVHSSQQPQVGYAQPLYHQYQQVAPQLRQF